jgi:hypothetical protein
MPKALNLDLKKLKARAFDRAEWAEEALRRYHSAIQNLDDVVAQQLRGLYNWMFVPTTLWPFNVQDVLEDCLAVLEKGKPLNSRHRLIIEMLPEPPDETVCAAVAGHEFHVQKGTYENLVKTQAKYSQNELAIRTDSQLRRQWSRIGTLAFRSLGLPSRLWPARLHPSRPPRRESRPEITTRPRLLAR